MNKNHIKESFFYLVLSFISIIVIYSLSSEMGKEGFWWSIPILFLLFGVASQYGKSH